jgi:hypothetical protein
VSNLTDEDGNLVCDCGGALRPRLLMTEATPYPLYWLACQKCGSKTEAVPIVVPLDGIVRRFLRAGERFESSRAHR